MQIQHHTDIFSYIKAMEAQFRLPISLSDAWQWNFKEHITLSELYNNSQLSTGKSDYKPVKNITRPILNLQHRTEDIEVKDVQIYVDQEDKFHLSLLVKKYHDDVFVVENNIDTFIDELNVSRIDFGGGLSKHLNKPCPEVVPLQSIVFCDQTDLLSGPIGIKHFYSPDQLLAMGDKGWGKEENGATQTLEEVIVLSREEKKDDKQGTITETPGRYIEVYEVHGNLPKRFSDHTYQGEDYETRMFIVCFYTPIGGKDVGERNGIILYTAEEKESPFKLIKRDPVYGRALGFGGAEELFEAQVWVNYDMIRMQNMLDAAAVTILKSSDPAVAAKHPGGLKNMKNLEIVDIAPNTDIAQVDTFPRNMRLFETSVAQWETHAQQMGAANDSIMGQSPTAGTPFKLQELVTNESRGLHDYRRGQYAKHLEEIYQDWIIPHIQKKITQGTKFLSELSLEDLQYVKEKIIANQMKYWKNEKVLNGMTWFPDEEEAYAKKVEEDFRKKGSKHFIEILKGEFKNTPLSVKVSVAGKSKNLAVMTDKIVNIFRFAFSNPQGFAQVMQIPGMAKSFNQILEFSGMSPADFSGIEKLAMQQQTQQKASLPVEETVNV